MTDNINHPSYYTGFSNGAEVIDITENLTGNGAQAVKYIARATRLDGRNKGAVLEDLKKAAFFVAREIQRVDVSTEDPITEAMEKLAEIQEELSK